MKVRTEQSDLVEVADGPSATHYSVVVVDSCRLFREGLAEILRRFYFEVAAVAANIEDALAEVGSSCGTIDLLICGLDSNDMEQQLAALQLLRSHDARTRTVLLLPSCPAEILAAAVLCRVNGVILKDVSSETLIATLNLVMRGQHVLPLAAALQIFARLQPDSNISSTVPADVSAPPAAVRPAEVQRQSSSKVAEAAGVQTSSQQARNFSLSDRETQILQCLIEGCANKMIARRLGIAEATVKVHIKGLLRKINVSNRTQAAIWALNQSVTASADQASIPAATDGNYDSQEDGPDGPEGERISDVIAIYPPAIRVLAATHA